MEDEKLNSAIKICFNSYYKTSTEQAIQKWPSFVDFLEAQISKDDCFSYPHTVFIEITSQCNLRCKHCFYTADERFFSTEDDFNTEEILALLEFLIEEVGIINFIITGREPLLNKDFFKIIKYLKSKNVYLKLQTNATLSTDEIINKLKKYFNPMTDTVQISLDGASKDVHDNIRGNGTFKKTTEAIKKFSANNINVIVAYAVASLNVHELPMLYELGKELKIKQLSLGRFETYTEEQNYLIPDKKDVVIGLAELTEKNNSKPAFFIDQSILKLYSFLDFEEGCKLLDEYITNENIPKRPKLKCHRNERITIYANGDVYLCPSLITDSKEFCLGSLKEKSFYEVWENRSNNVFFHARCHEISICKKCKYLNACNAGCPANAYFSYGTISAPDMYCNYAKKLIKKEIMEI